MSEWMRVSDWTILFEKNKWMIVFLRFCLSKEPPKHRSSYLDGKSQTFCYFKQVACCPMSKPPRVKSQECRKATPAFSFTHIALWRNDGFLHSFCIFSKVFYLGKIW